MFAKIENGNLTWLHMFKKQELPITDIIWAYLQQEDVHGRFCCGNANFPIGRLVVVRKDRTREVFQYDGMEKPKEMLNQLQQANPEIAIGYTEANRERFAAIV